MFNPVRHGLVACWLVLSAVPVAVLAAAPSTQPDGTLAADPRVAEPQTAEPQTAEPQAAGTQATGTPAAKPNFDKLLARAREQEAAGRRWFPPGDNFTETVTELLDLLPNATAAQISELQRLVEQNQAASPQSTELTTRSTDGPSKDHSPTAGTRTTALPMSPAPTGPVAPPRSVAVAPPKPEPEPEQALVPEQTSAPEQAPAPEQVPAPVPVKTPVVAAAPAQTSAPARNPAPAQAPVRATATRDVLVPGTTTPGTRPLGARVPDAHTADLYARGQAAERRGDISGARRYYLAAAQQGNGAAARGLGRLYDPEYLNRAAIGGVDADLAAAREWYERAAELGDHEATPLLQALSVR